MNSFADRLKHKEFYEQIDDIVSVGLQRYTDKYMVGGNDEIPFIVYEEYSRRDVSLLMNSGKDLSSTMYGMKRIDDVFSFLSHIVRSKLRLAFCAHEICILRRSVERPLIKRDEGQKGGLKIGICLFLFVP